MCAPSVHASLQIGAALHTTLLPTNEMVECSTRSQTSADSHPNLKTKDRPVVLCTGVVPSYSTVQ